MNDRQTGNTPKRHKDLPEINPAAYHGPIGEYVTSISDNTESDPVAVLVQALSWFGGATGRRAHFARRKAIHYPQIWPLIVGPTSVGRKGTSASDSLTSLSALSDIPRRRSGLTSGEGLVDAFLPKDPDSPTPESRLLITESEWESVLARTRREGSTLSSMIRDAYDNQPLSTLNTKINARLVNNYSLTIVGHITPGAFKAGMTGIDLSNGFLNRFIVISARRPHLVPEPEPMTQKEDELLALIVNRALDGPENERLELSSAAKAWYRDWYIRWETAAESRTERVAMATGRATDNLMRMAMIYSRADKRDKRDKRGKILEEHLKAAAAVIDYSLACATELLAPGQAGDDQKIVEALRARGELSLEEIRDVFARHTPARAINEALQTLVDVGLIKGWTEPTGGRPRTMYCLTADQ